MRSFVLFVWRFSIIWIVLIRFVFWLFRRYKCVYLIKVVYYIVKYFFKLVQNYLVIIDIIMDKKYISLIGKKELIFDENLYF